eukprot:1469225-Rhodomonas_salina.2
MRPFSYDLSSCLYIGDAAVLRQEGVCVWGERSAGDEREQAGDERRRLPPDPCLPPPPGRARPSNLS